MKINIDGVKMPKSKASQQTFDALVNSAEQLFGRNGYSKTTVGDITKAANIATGTFYIYFESKYAIYEYILEKYRLGLKSALAKAVKDCTTRAEKEYAGLKTFIMGALENPLCYHLVWESLYVNQDLFKKYYQSFAEDYARALKRDREELNTTEYRTIAFMLMGINNFVGLQSLFENDTESDVDRRADIAIEVLRKGLFNK